MHRPRDRVRRAVGSHSLATTAERVDPADHFRDGRAVLVSLGDRVRSDEPVSRPFADHEQPTDLQTDCCTDGDTSTDVSTHLGAHSQADRAAHATAHATSDAQPDSTATEPPHHTRLQGRYAGRADVRYGWSRR